MGIEPILSFCFSLQSFAFRALSVTACGIFLHLFAVISTLFRQCLGLAMIRLVCYLTLLLRVPLLGHVVFAVLLLILVVASYLITYFALPAFVLFLERQSFISAIFPSFYFYFY